MNRSRQARRSTLRSGLAIDLTAMVDVVFLLIIFFMVSTTFITLESGLPVDLPQAQTAQAQMTDLPTVTVTREGQIFLAGSEIREDELVAALRAILADTPSSTVVLRADQSIQFGLPVRVIDLIKQAGAQRVAIATGGG
jgi:biopolymer transport protein ExbD